MFVAKALVADDDLGSRTLTCKILADLGLEAEGAEDGFDALIKLQSTPFDLLITDLDMPRLNGHALVTALRADGNPIPILVVSGVGDGTDIVELFRYQVGEYVRKPFRRKELLASVRRLLGTSAPESPGSAHADEVDDDATTGGTVVPLVPPPPAPLASAQAAMEPASCPSAPPPPVETTPAPKAAPEKPLTLEAALRRLTQQLAAGKAELPAPLPSMAQLVQMRRDPTISSQAIVSMLSASPSLAAAAVQMANTAFYDRGSKVSNLSQAAVRLGNRTLVNLAMTVLHRRFHRVRNSELQRLVDATWADTMLAAQLTRELAGATYGVDPDDAYMAALFHNVGDMAILRAADGVINDRTMSAAALDTLKQECARHHEQVGGRLLHAWGFPPPCIRVALSHHRGAPPAGHGPLSHPERRLVDVLNVALHFVQGLSQSEAISQPPSLNFDLSLKAIDVSASRARFIAEKIAGKDDSN